MLATPLLALLSLTSYGLRRLKPSNRQVAGLLRWLAWGTLGAAGLFALCALLAQPDFGGQYQIYERVTLLAQIVFLAALPLLGIVVFSGTALALRRRKKQPSMAEHPMSRIMQRLAPEERDYLQQQLDQRYVGLGSDGELRSLDDLLDEQDLNQEDTQ